MSETWEEPGGGVRVTLESEETIVIRRGVVTAAEVVVVERGGGRPKRFRPHKIAVRYAHREGDDAWSMVVFLEGPSVLANSRPGNTYLSEEFYQGQRLLPWWAAAFATAHTPVLLPGEDPEAAVTDEEINGLPPEVDAP